MGWSAPRPADSTRDSGNPNSTNARAAERARTSVTF
jgi:hypothetical protein